MRKFFWIVVIALLLALPIAYYSRHALLELLTGHEALAFKEARKRLDEGNPRAALRALQPYLYQNSENSAIANQWKALYLEAALAAKDGQAASIIYQQSPALLDQNEEGSLLVADYLTKTFQPIEYEQLRAKWKGKEVKEESWFNLDADKLILEGNRTGATELLNSRVFEGKADSGRLIRLALLNVKENPKKSWEYLASAYAKDPDNPEIRSYRARLLEAVNQPGLALNEYLAAAKADPKQLFYQDQLAEFYRRNRRYDLAINAWKESLDNIDSDLLWLKAWFWSRVVAPMGIKWQEVTPPEGAIEPFLSYLKDLPADTFWNQEAFSKLPHAETYLNRQQSTFWLRLLNALQNHNENGAWELLQYNPFSAQSWNPELENALKRILTFRKIGTFNIDIVETEPADSALKGQQKNLPASKHPFTVELDSLTAKGADAAKITPNLKLLLNSEFGLSTPFLVAGWLKAALDLAPHPIVLSADMPEWVAYDYAQAIRDVRGAGEALEFIAKQPPTPALSVLEGEILIAQGRLEEGAEKLRANSALDSEMGYRAAWLLSLLYIEKKQFDQARAVIAAQPRLAQDTLGKETLARISLLEDKPEEAAKIYEELAPVSWEAKSFLARSAFAQKDYAKAKDLTEQLLRQFPNNAVLMENYKRILEVSAKGQ